MDNDTLRTYSEQDLGEEISNAELKEHLLDMLSALDAFCREHGLRYYLSGGTLLGAVRHKGFIPWDDDIDVNMPRPDCEKLLELTGGKLRSYVVKAPCGSGVYRALYYRMFDESVLMKKRTGPRTIPAFLDIFPIEGLPDDKGKNRRHYARLIFWRRLADSLSGKKIFRGASLGSKLFHALLRPFAALWGQQKLFENMNAVMTSIPFGSTGSIGVMAARTHTTEERVPMEEYLQPMEISFEGRSMIAPAGYDRYLRQLYGNYMQLPPESKRVSDHAYVPHLPKTPIPSEKDEELK